MNISHTRRHVVQSCGSYVTQHYAHVELQDIEGPEMDKMLRCVTGFVGLCRNSCSLQILPLHKSRVSSRKKKKTVRKQQKSFWFNHETLPLGATVSERVKIIVMNICKCQWRFTAVTVVLAKAPFKTKLNTHSATPLTPSCLDFSSLECDWSKSKASTSQ